MKPITSFLPRVLPYTPGCSEPLVLMALADAAIEFCERTLVIQRKLPSLSTQAGQSVYELDLPPQQSVAVITRVWVAGQPLGSVAAEHAHHSTLPSGTPTSFFTSAQDGVLELLLAPVPTETGQPIEILASLSPVRGATELDDVLLENWAEPIASGALVRLLTMPNQTFSDVATAAMMNQRFERQVSIARIESRHGRVAGTVNMALRALA